MTKIPNEFLFLNEQKDMIFIIKPDMSVSFANKSACDFCGIDLEEMHHYTAWELPLWKHSEILQNDLMFQIGHVFSTEEPLRMEAKAIDITGEFSELDLSIQVVHQEGLATAIMLTAFNITDLIHTKGHLTKRDRQINAFFKNSTEGYFFQTLPETAILPDHLTTEALNKIYDAQRLESVSKKVYDYIGLPESTDAASIDILDLLNISNEERIAIWEEMLSHGRSELKRELINKESKKKVILELKFVGIFIDKNHFEGNFCIVSNITQRYIYERELNFLANKDPLTGLNNRRNFHTLSNELLKSDSECYSVIMFDIDRFKTINDTHGHDVGDIAIRKVGDIIDSTISENGVVGRYGGEEFIALLPMNPVGAMDVAEDIRKGIESLNINYGAGSLKLTISAGIHAFVYNNEDDLLQGITYADKALLEAKKTGRNKSILYDDELHGLKAIDKLTGTYNKNALVYKGKLFHDNLRKFDITYGIIVIRQDTQIVHQTEILSQFVKQTADLLNGMLRDHDVVGRFDDMTFVVMIGNVNGHVIKNIRSRVEASVTKLSEKFDHLVSSQVTEVFIDDWSLKLDDIYDEALGDQA